MPIERQVEGVKCRKFGIKEIVGLSIEIDLFEIVGSQIDRRKCAETLYIPAKHVSIPLRRVTCLARKDDVLHFVCTAFYARKNMVNSSFFRRAKDLSAICTRMIALLQFLNLLFVQIGNLPFTFHIRFECLRTNHITQAASAICKFAYDQYSNSANVLNFRSAIIKYSSLRLSLTCTISTTENQYFSCSSSQTMRTFFPSKSCIAKLSSIVKPLRLQRYYFFLNLARKIVILRTENTFFLYLVYPIGHFIQEHVPF